VVIWKKSCRHTARICIKSEQFAPRRASIILSFINTSPAAACFMIIAAHLSEAHSAAAWMQRAYSRTNVLTIDLPAHPDRRRCWPTLSNFSSGPFVFRLRRATRRALGKKGSIERWQRASYCLGPESLHGGSRGLRPR
jgi:hypothetical protein